MSDEPAKFILGDTAIATAEDPPRRRFFGRGRQRETTPLTHCENCGAKLTGSWCAHCGQPAVDYRRSFRHVIVDVLDSFLNWDSKFFATLYWLIIRPWRLTNEFLAGHRVRYLNPLRLYLLASIVFFFVINHWGKSIHLERHHFTAGERAEINADLQKEKDLSPAAKEKVKKVLSLSDESPTASPTGSPTTSDYGPFVKLDKPASTPFEKWLETNAREKMGENGTRVQLFLVTLFSNLPYMMFCCIPVFAFVLKLLYIRGRIFYIDHLIYALHIHSFAYFGIIIAIYATEGLARLRSGAFSGLAIAAVWVAFSLQILFSIRRVYRQGWFFSLFKFCVGGLIYLTVLIIGVVATFFITLALPA